MNNLIATPHFDFESKNAYFYGYYFYFASNCEAGRCV